MALIKDFTRSVQLQLFGYDLFVPVKSAAKSVFRRVTPGLIVIVNCDAVFYLV